MKLNTKILVKKSQRERRRRICSCFYSTTKTMINYKYNLDKSFKKFFTGLTLGLIKDLAG